MATQLVLLAAGQGKRMKSDRPKVLHAVAGRALFAHALASAEGLDVGRKVVVVGNGAEDVAAAARAVDPEIVTAHQADRLGTGHAVAQARAALEGAGGDTVVLYGDTPFIRPETLAAMAERRGAGADIVVLGFHAADPGRYGRLVTDGDTLLRIVEFNDATLEERALTLCNSGVVMAATERLFELVAALGNDNAAGEYYLTDIVEIGRDRGLTAAVVTCAEEETLGVNSRADLAAAEAVFQARARAAAMENGVTLDAPETVHFSHDTEIGRDCVVEPNVVFAPGVTVEPGARIRAFSHLEGAHVSAGAVVGPYARLRPGTRVSEGARVGNFVEVKNAEIGEGAKLPHLSYIGDATVGARANIGAGTITCNYDGVSKHRTAIGEAAFIGSNTMLVAPVTVGAEAVTASGSVVVRDVPDGDLAIARGEQINKQGYGRRLMDMLRARAGKGK
ncbi:MAG: bifunctional UDP-N-acetylglucosamine diphosphorylase/glucosamine-1-phosphate N-acetyltransferase GlmU [Paracoccaceae bacterium]|nr:bifunctional UDP-N-acetylglucosamine diphosphorylase/glucosamine-1-phosphate N-acetyltransferase GlmU [Paracoccaceae bacterium]